MCPVSKTDMEGKKSQEDSSPSSEAMQVITYSEKKGEWKQQY